MLPIQFDIHTHSIASGHGSKDTITDMVKMAYERGLQLLAITEHGPATVGSCKTSYFQNLRFAPKQRCGISMLYGCEVNILDDKGTLDMEEKLLKDLDLNIASLHIQNIKPRSIEENTNAVLSAIRNPYIHIIGHPDDTKYKLDYECIVQEAMKYQVLLELNNGSLRKEGYRGDTKVNDAIYLNLCKKYSYPIILGSDSHGKGLIGQFDESLMLLRQLNFPVELVLNYNLTRFQSWLERKRITNEKSH
jgi:putative hydrolase